MNIHQARCVSCAHYPQNRCAKMTIMIKVVAAGYPTDTWFRFGGHGTGFRFFARHCRLEGIPSQLWRVGYRAFGGKRPIGRTSLPWSDSRCSSRTFGANTNRAFVGGAFRVSPCSRTSLWHRCCRGFCGSGLVPCTRSVADPWLILGLVCTFCSGHHHFFSVHRSDGQPAAQLGRAAKRRAS